VPEALAPELPISRESLGLDRNPESSEVDAMILPFLRSAPRTSWPAMSLSPTWSQSLRLYSSSPPFLPKSD